VHRFEGDYPAAVLELERAFAVASREEQHWEAGMILLALALAHLEADEPDAASDCARRLAPVAARVGDGVEGPVSDAVLELVRARQTGRWHQLDRALQTVRKADGKAMLATLCNFAAELALAERQLPRAASLAAEALRAACAVSLVSQQVLARATLARAGGEPEALEALRRDCEKLPSARALARAHDLLAGEGG
jgi:hypothetical protein